MRPKRLIVLRWYSATCLWMASPCKPFQWISEWELGWGWLTHLCEVATCWRLSGISLSSSGSRFSGVSASQSPVLHITEDRSLKLKHVACENPHISCHSGAHVLLLISWMKPLKMITPFNSLHWICKSFNYFNLLAHRKGKKTPGVSLRSSKTHLCHCSFGWCWEMKCIRVSGKGYSLIYGIMPS